MICDTRNIISGKPIISAAAPEDSLPSMTQTRIPGQVHQGRSGHQLCRRQVTSYPVTPRWYRFRIGLSRQRMDSGVRFQQSGLASLAP
jgi:hypothetical protein